MRQTRQDVIDRACKLGLCVSPANHTALEPVEYRFYDAPDGYWAGNPLGACLGVKSAMVWLDGYEAGQSI